MRSHNQYLTSNAANETALVVRLTGALQCELSMSLLDKWSYRTRVYLQKQAAGHLMLKYCRRIIADTFMERLCDKASGKGRLVGGEKIVGYGLDEDIEGGKSGIDTERCQTRRNGDVPY